MDKSKNYTCSCCGKIIQGVPLDYGYNTPYYWSSKNKEKDRGLYSITPDICKIESDYFIRAVIQIPIIGSDETFNWGVWTSLSKKNFNRYVQIYGSDTELDEDNYFGWLSNSIKIYPETLSLECSVKLQGGNSRPFILLDHTNKHPLCQEQHSGITMHRAEEIIKLLTK